jgi:ABC-2 type transport system ATP-binding protein
MLFVSAENVCKQYGGTAVLRGASLEVRSGEIVALLGPNGSGKTTLIKILSTLLVKDSGRVKILGHDLDKDERAIRSLFGYAGQDSDRSAYARLTVVENLRFFAALRGLRRPEVDVQIEKLARSFGVESIVGKLHMTLSGGEKQAMVIMRAFLTEPSLVYLDEPSKGLDPITASRLRAFLRHYVAEKRASILLTSHSLAEVDELADRLGLIRNGAVAFLGTNRELKSTVGLQGILEIPRAALTAAIEASLARTGARRIPNEAENEWQLVGIDVNPARLEAVLQLLREHRIDGRCRYRPVTLEDAFMHHYARLPEQVERLSRD